MPHITTTLTASQDYTDYRKNAGGENIPVRKVTIQGGSNVADKHFITPLGVVTAVSDEELAILEANPVFKMHVENGFVTVHKTPKAQTANLEKEDESAPLTPQKYAKRGKRAPVTKLED